MPPPLPHFLGLDIGTSATKALLCDESGRVVASASSGYELLQPQPNWSEQRPQDWWVATCAAIREVLTRAGTGSQEIAAVGLTGQMHGSVLLGADAMQPDGQAQPLRNALLWNDQRTGDQCEEIEALLGGRRRVVELVGNAALTGFTLPKLLWVREHEPQIWAAVRRILLPKDFIAYRLTGQLATDVGDASGTLLFDVDGREWSKAMCRAFDIDQSLLPPAHESATIIGEVSTTAAVATGLRARVPVIIGSGDNMAGAVGAGVVTPGTAVATLGTSGVIYAHASFPRRDLPDDVLRPAGRVHTMCAAAGNISWCITGCMLAAGLSLRWARDTLAPGRSYESIIAEAQDVRPGCEGLVFLPYLTGERCPHPNRHAKGGFIGLTSRHTRAHLLRAVIEGITFTLGEIFDIMRSSGVTVETVRLSGGGNRSAFWRQLQADVFKCPVATTNSEEGGGALGAAVLGMVGAKAFRSVSEATTACIAITETREPDAKMAGELAMWRERFSRVYPAVAPLFEN